MTGRERGQTEPFWELMMLVIITPISFIVFVRVGWLTVVDPVSASLFVVVTGLVWLGSLWWLPVGREYDRGQVSPNPLAFLLLPAIAVVAALTGVAAVDSLGIPGATAVVLAAATVMWLLAVYMVNDPTERDSE